MFFSSLPLLLFAQLSDVALGDGGLLNVLLRKKRDFDEYDDNIFMFRNPNVTIPQNRTRISIHPDWLFFTQTTPRSTVYWGQKGLTKEWSTFAWYNDRVTVYLDTFLRGLKKAPYTVYPRYKMPSTTPKVTTLSLFEQMTLYNKKDLIFKLPWAYAPHQNFRKEMGFGPNDTIDMNKVDMATIQAFENKYKVTVMYKWPNTHPEYLAHVNFEKYKHTVVFSDEMSTRTPLNLSLVDFEDWFVPQVPRLKLSKVENLENQLQVMLDEVFELHYLDKNLFQTHIDHDQLLERYNRFRKLRKREYRTWYRRKVWIPWKHLVRDGVREWFFVRDRCVPSPGHSYFYEINRQFEQLSEDLNETLYSYFGDMEDQFLHWYANTYGPHWNMSLEEIHDIPYTQPTQYSPVTASDEFYLYEKPGILPMERKRRRRALDGGSFATPAMNKDAANVEAEPENDQQRNNINDRKRRYLKINGDGEINASQRRSLETEDFFDTRRYLNDSKGDGTMDSQWNMNESIDMREHIRNLKEPKKEKSNEEQALDTIEALR